MQRISCLFTFSPLISDSSMSVRSLGRWWVWLGSIGVLVMGYCSVNDDKRGYRQGTYPLIRLTSGDVFGC